MRRPLVGPAVFQLSFPCVKDAQAGWREHRARYRRHAPETRLRILFPSVPVDTCAPLRRATSCRGTRAGCPRGFSLVELTIVVGVILTLAALAIPSFLQAMDNARYAKAVGDINAIETDIVAYEAVYGVLPNTLADIGRSDLVDPWGNPYVYTNYSDATKKNLIRKDRFLHPLNSDYDLFSAGVDGQWKAPLTAAQSHDDIIRASDGSYVGLASNF